MNSRGIVMREKIGLVLIGLLLSCAVCSEEHLTAFRDAEGIYSKLSHDNIVRMRELARQYGTISVWVSFGISFQGNPELRTADVVAQEALAKEEAYTNIVEPLVAAGDATVLELAEFQSQAPGFFLEVTRQGIHKLAKDRGVKHIGFLAKQFE